MREIRPIQSHEADAFLQLLCSSFGLDFVRARRIFYEEPLFDLNRKWAVFDGHELCACLTTVPLEFGDGKAMGIAGVATKEDRRGMGLGTELLRDVLQSGASNGENRALLFASNTRLYEKLGFEVLDHVVSYSLTPAPQKEHEYPLTFGGVRKLYDAWASEDLKRLRRDDRRWAYWRFSLKNAFSAGSGYVCLEGARVREALPDANGQRL
jgi:predicted acetyltransferase